MKNSIEQKVEELEKRVEKLERLTEDRTVSATAPNKGREKTVSPKEFLLARRPGTEVATTFFLGCYAEYVLGMESFNAVELKDLYRGARVPVPVNINATIDKNITKGLFVEVPEKKNGKKAWAISLSGEQECVSSTT